MFLLMKLFEVAQVGPLSLRNRVVMAPMTRSRATGNVPNDLMVKYYGDRATAGLIITEGTAPSPNGLGYARIPGCFNDEQVAGWKKVTDQVHAKGGRIFLQLMHTGRVSHPNNMPKGARILAPSAVVLSGEMYTDAAGPQAYPVPEEMTEKDIEDTIGEYVHSAELAIKAGFDGVELHGANGYLIDQFLNPMTNKRTDRWGGEEGRKLFALEIAARTAKAIGKERVGIRLSPYGAFNGLGAFDGIDAFYGDLATKLSAIGILYIHGVDHSSMGAPPVSAEVKRLLRQNFNGAIILSGGYDAARAEHDLLEGRGDLVAFGRPFIANPTLVDKLKNGTPLTNPDPNKFYTPGPEGYNDWA